MAPGGLPLSARIPVPPEILDCDAADPRPDQTQGRDPASKAALDRCMVDVVVDAKDRWVEVLQDDPEVPDRGSNLYPRVGVIHGASAVFAVELAQPGRVLPQL